MDEDSYHMTESIINLTLDIIYLLTGEDYLVFKLSDSLATPNLRQMQSPIKKPSAQLLTPGGNNGDKVLDITNKIIELLTRKMDPGSKKPPERCISPVYFQDSTKEHPSTPHHYQDEGLPYVKTEVLDEKEAYMKGYRPCKVEENSEEIRTDGQYARNGIEKLKVIPPDPEIDNKDVNSNYAEETLAASSLHPSSDRWRTFPNHLHSVVDLADRRVTPDGEKPYSCSECGRAFTQKSNLKTHQKLHTGVRPFSCSQCGKGFKRNTHLVIHQRVHTGEKPFTCLQCGKSFTRKSSLLSHQRSHTGEKPYSCSICGKRFSEKAYFLRHERTHAGYFPYLCPQCGKGFAYKSTLASHQKEHLGARPYSCSECNKSFRFQESLTKHQKTHRGEKPYSCSDCGKCFVTKSHLLRHMQIHPASMTFSSMGK